MVAKVRLLAFDITKCGYYKPGSWRAPALGTIEDLLSDLKTWIGGKELRLTKTFDPAEDGNIPPAYCFDLQRSSSGDWLITTWNEVPLMKGGIAIAAGRAKVGSVSVTTGNVPPGGIPGYPTYFLIMPKEGVLFSVKPYDAMHTGHPGLQEYLSAYVRHHSSYVRTTKGEDGEKVIAGYAPPGQLNPLPLHPMFKSRKKRAPGQVQFIRDNRERITKLVGRDMLTIQAAQKRQVAASLFSLLGMSGEQLPPHEFSFSYEFGFSPSPQQLEDVLVTSEEGTPETAELGFRIRGYPNQIFWVDHAFLKLDFELPLTPSEEGVYDAEDLLSELVERRRFLTGLLQTSAAALEEDIEDIDDAEALAEDAG